MWATRRSRSVGGRSSPSAPRHQAIWYDLLNEPINRSETPVSTPAKWPDWAQRLIDQIRQTDPVHPIVIEPGPGGMPTGFKTFPALRGSNLIYSFHQYTPHAYTHQGVRNTKQTDLAHPYAATQRPWPGYYDGMKWDKDHLVKAMQPAVDFQRHNPGVRMYVGEFSVAHWAPNGERYLRDCLEIFEQNGWDWTYHCLKGPNVWSLDYDGPYCADPKKAQPAKGMTERGKVVLEYLRRNDFTPSK